MNGGTQFRGVSQDQDPKFRDKQKKLLATMKFPASFDHKIRRNAFKLEPLRPWIERRVTELLEMDDEVVTEYAYSLIDGAGDVVDAKELQINLQGFLFGHAATFVADLWQLLMDAEQRADGIPLVIHQEMQIEKMLQEEKRRHSAPVKTERVIPQVKREPRSRSRSRSREGRHRSRRRTSRSRSSSREKRKRKKEERSSDRSSKSRSPSPRDRRHRHRHRRRSRSHSPSKNDNGKSKSKSPVRSRSRSKSPWRNFAAGTKK